MRTVQMTLDESLVELVDKEVRKLGISRSQFTRNALRLALEQNRRKNMESKHQKGYIDHPVTENEFISYDDEIWNNV